MKKKGQIAALSGVIISALCCIGFPALISIFVSLGLGFIINDSILLPILGISLIFLGYSSYSFGKSNSKLFIFFVTILSGLLIVLGVFFSQWIAIVGIIGIVFTGLYPLIYVAKRKRAYESKQIGQSD
ncbi:MAG: hypothetical protein PF693_15210 [Spirochaetia bacterium]|jgi:hypothetical protein|nr:hypothetical protein [Spirochaetia bacterium]